MQLQCSVKATSRNGSCEKYIDNIITLRTLIVAWIATCLCTLSSFTKTFDNNVLIFCHKIFVSHFT